MNFGQKLVEQLKGQGLEVAEESAKVLVEAVFETAKWAAKESENKIDDVFISVLDLAKPEVLKLVDEINKEDNK